VDPSTGSKETLYDQYASIPDYGKVIRGTGGLRKGRIAKDATGKSGGYRVFSFYLDARNPVFLLWIIDKTEDENITDAEAAAFKGLTKQLKEACR